MHPRVPHNPCREGAISTSAQISASLSSGVRFAFSSLTLLTPPLQRPDASQAIVSGSKSTTLTLLTPLTPNGGCPHSYPVADDARRRIPEPGARVPSLPVHSIPRNSAYLRLFAPFRKKILKTANQRNEFPLLGARLLGNFITVSNPKSRYLTPSNTSQFTSSADTTHLRCSIFASTPEVGIRHSSITNEDVHQCSVMFTNVHLAARPGHVHQCRVMCSNGRLLPAFLTHTLNRNLNLHTPAPPNFRSPALRFRKRQPAATPLFITRTAPALHETAHIMHETAHRLHGAAHRLHGAACTCPGKTDSRIRQLIYG